LFSDRVFWRKAVLNVRAGAKIDHPARLKFHRQAGFLWGAERGSALLGDVFSVGYRRYEDGGAIRESAAGGVGGGEVGERRTMRPSTIETKQSFATTPQTLLLEFTSRARSSTGS
jgi:hypothetical protein